MFVPPDISTRACLHHQVNLYGPVKYVIESFCNAHNGIDSMICSLQFDSYSIDGLEPTEGCLRHRYGPSPSQIVGRSFQSHY